MRVAICDDVKQELEHTKQQLEKAYVSLDLLIDCYQDGRELISSIEKNNYDLLILDIEMPYLNGIDTAKFIRELGSETAIVFLTSHVEYAIKGYEVNALRYLTKPVKQEQLSEIVTYLIEKNKKGKKLLLKDEEDMVLVPVNEILYMEAQNQDIRIVTTKKEYQRRYNMRDYEVELQAYSFLRCHRSYLVNLARIAKISSGEIILDNRESIPLSRTKEKECKLALNLYIKRSAF